MNQRNRKRLISIAAAFLFILSLALNVSAAKLSDRELLDLKVFGILTGDESGELHLDQTITRAEFSKLVVKLTKAEGAADAISAGMVFRDVPKDHWAYGSIMILASQGLINGSPDGNFYPEQEITAYQAIKILVNALGYYSIAEKSGGYPMGYAVTGGQIGVTKGVIVDGDAPLVRSDAMRLIYNCLDAPRMEWVSTDPNGNVSLKEGELTLRDILMGDARNGLAKIRAIISANYDSWLYEPVANIKEWEVEANQTLFDQGTSGAAEYFGQEVDMYVKASEASSQYTIEQVIPTKNNTVLTLDRLDVQALDPARITYTDEEDETRYEDISADAIYLFNGRVVPVKDVKFNEIANGTVRLISNDGDGAFDVVMISSYESYEVDSVDVKNEQIVLTADKKYNGQRKISLDDKKYDTNTRLMDAAGETLELETLEKGDIISVFASNDHELVRILHSNQTAEGVVSELIDKDSNPQIKIDEDFYYVEKGVELDNLLGSLVTAKLNYEGKVVSYQRDVLNKKYAAIVKTAEDGGVGGDVSVKALLPGKLAEEEEEVEDTGESKKEDTVPVLYAKNSQVKVFRMAEKVRFPEWENHFDPETGEQTTSLVSRVYSASELKERIDREMHTNNGFLVVSYQLNKAGEINRMEYPEAVSMISKKTYNAYEKTFGKSSGGAFGVTDETLSICVPSEGISSDDDYLAKVKMTNNQEYRVIGYDQNSKTHCPDLTVIHAPMSYTSPGNIISTSKIAVVTRITSAVDANGDEVRQVTLLTPNSEKTYPISDHSATDQDLNAIRMGDVLYYSLDSMDYLDGYQWLSRCVPLPPSRENTVGDNLVFVGDVLDVNYNVVSNTSNRWVDEVVCVTDDNSQVTFEVRQESTPPIYVYNSAKNTAEIGDSLDLLSPHERIIVCATAATRQVKAIVMIV